jgi:hypothetical protein
MDFHDRRNLRHLPTQEDYETPLTKASLTEANRRFRQSGVPKVIHSDPEKAANIVSTTMRLRRKGAVNPQTVGEYLEFLNGMGETNAAY